ncbi:cyclin-C1-1-like isoform X2 [Miscanthus floridulus]|uniref:cyclin-C1-1-like isoform X2 n=1 Tax=Miscanthus floridulus TaxID=154761 RepID=UPI003457F90E
MAANFWMSSHCKQLLDPEDVDLVPAADWERGITLEEFRLIKIHMSFHIWRLAQQVKVRQRVIATAVTYFRRVYTRSGAGTIEALLWPDGKGGGGRDLLVEPTSVLDCRRSPSPPHSTSTLSSSLGGAAGDSSSGVAADSETLTCCFFISICSLMHVVAAFLSYVSEFK